MNIKLIAIIFAIAFALFSLSKKYTIVRKTEKKIEKKPVKPEPEEDESEKES